MTNVTFLKVTPPPYTGFLVYSHRRDSSSLRSCCSPSPTSHHPGGTHTDGTAPAHTAVAPLPDFPSPWGYLHRRDSSSPYCCCPPSPFSHHITLGLLTQTGQLQPRLVLAFSTAVRWDGWMAFISRRQSLWNTLSHTRQGYSVSTARNSS